jgi:hypothetical protein
MTKDEYPSKKEILKTIFDAVYAQYPKKEFVGLTDDEIGDIYCNTPAQPISNGDIDLMFDFARAIEQALKDKNT